MPKKKKKKGSDESGAPAVPESMTTFADMITLMLTFFILLCTFAETQNVEYFASGVGSFRRAVESFGLPGIMGSNQEPISMSHMREEQERSRNPGAEEFWEIVDERLIEENPETLRDALLESLETKDDVVIPGGVRFSKRSSQLPGDASAPLDLFIKSIEGLDLVVEIIAFGDTDQESLSDSLALAVERSRAVGRYLTDRAGLPSSRVRFSGLKPAADEPTMKGLGEEILLRLERP